MFSIRATLTVLFLAFSVIILDRSEVEGRYLPTRSNSDRIEKLRELLKELLDNELEQEEMNDVPKWHPDTKLFYKRDVAPH